MFDFYLPLEDYFAKILLENRIQNWEAKLFWINIEHLNLYEEKSLRKKMYSALRVLITNDFLSVEYSKYNGRIFLYSETIKLQQFRKKMLASNYKDLIQNEKKLIDNELEQFELQSKFIDELYLKFPELAPQYLKLKHDINLNLKYCDAKLKTIHNLIEII
ncbi:hypothetical protein QLH32_18305 (plasmid) [Acinetobacter corruptisaponis]|uniref:Uncharacterized protein n=1 Tax=Acinetobacter corruptisaponis TaxID=3045147 RepID=A0ABY8SB42_9GAMM|nr:hypothetical protein [Acinetobacter sp. KCTC 92772]WHP07732.1 hypothetical protein QLH32_18305 [Acinetobacter sp. KCTC 92772]